MLTKNKLNKIMAAAGIVAWIAIAIFIVEFKLIQNLAVFYIILFAAPTILTYYTASLLQNERRKKRNGDFYFYTISSIVIVDFIVFYLVLSATFSLS